MRTVLCFGDSNTHGTCALETPLDIRRFPRDVRWPGVMAEILGPAWHVVEEGHPARTTVHPDPVEGEHKRGLAILPALLESHRPLDLVILMLGTNDLKVRFSVTAFDIAISVERLVLAIRQSPTGPDFAPPKVLLVAPVPIEETGFLAELFLGGAAKSRALAGYYQTIADRHGVGFFDAGSVISVDPVDGIHFTAEDHRRLGRAMASAVQAID